MNFRLLIVNPDNLIRGDRILLMGKYGEDHHLLCKLQMEIVDEFKNKIWVDIPWVVEK